MTQRAMSRAEAVRQEGLEALRRRFVAEALGDVAEIDAILAADADPGADTQPGRRLHKLAHDLRGTGGSYGFTAIAAVATELERAYLARAGAAALAERAARLADAVRITAGAGAGTEPPTDRPSPAP